MPSQLKDKIFMFTGTLSVTRDEAQRVVEELGGIAGSSVSRQTDYLVCGDDQVGKSSKWEKAGLLGVTRVNEEYFWDLVKEAQNESELYNREVEVVAYLEGDDFTDEQWETIARECPEVRVMTSDQFERFLKAYSPSYENPDKLDRLVKEYQLELLPPTICKFCGGVIPYSIYKEGTYSTPAGVYFCFNCRQYSHQDKHNCVWLDPGVKEGYYMCKLCGDFIQMDTRDWKEHKEAYETECYWHSVEYLVDRIKKERVQAEISKSMDKFLEGVHICLEYEKDEEMVAERGTWLKCKVCGKSKFVSYDKFEASMRKRTEQSLTK